MKSFSNRSRTIKQDKQTGRGTSISAKISFKLTIILVPLLALLIAASCFLAARTVSALNEKILDAQTDYAVSMVDDFFSSKIAAVSMFEQNRELQDYFHAVSKPEDITDYKDKKKVLEKLSGALMQMSDEGVLQTWAADKKTDQYLLSTGEQVAAGLGSTVWYEPVRSEKEAMVSDPYLDPATGKEIVSIVAPVFSASGKDVAGFIGMDVYMSSLSNMLSQIKVGEKGYLELVSGSGEYIYSQDAATTGKNVDDLDISDDYKNGVKNRDGGIQNFIYKGDSYIAVFRNSDKTGWLAIATLPISEVNAPRNQLIGVLVILSLIILVVLILVITGIVRKMMKPLKEISRNMEEFSTGNLEVDIQIHSNDEIGRMADSVRSSIQILKELIKNVSGVLEELSRGNLDVTVKGEYVGDFRHIGAALDRIVSSLNSTLCRIRLSADQVSLGSNQVSSGAQALSKGSLDQATTVEELAESVEEISRRITANADNAAETKKKMYEVGDEAGESNQRMKEMLAAIEDIHDSSKEIDKIVKAIEDIAFQTNILALNAAVEAARAGESGSGFAAVAEEVRKLASKSSKASKNTALLIGDSLKTVENGTRIANETAESLYRVVEGVNGVVDAIDDIAEASDQQAKSVEQVTQGIGQISNVVQMNSATAEESATASEELSAQALLLKELIEKFRLKEQ